MELPAGSGHVITVRVENDHLESLAADSRSLLGIAELVWNGLDAEGTDIRIRLERNALDGLDAVEVVDNGHGMSHAEALREFEHLGGSWKHLTTRSRNRKRLLHGREGKGRWRAFSIGALVRWTTVAEGESGRERTVITGSEPNLTQFKVSDPEPTRADIGTTVRVENVKEKAAGALLADDAANKLASRLAPYLEKYPDVVVRFGNRQLDPQSLQTGRREYDLELPEGVTGPASLLIIEWRGSLQRELFLCDEHGLALHQCTPGIQARGFNFTAYIRWPGFRQYESELGAEELNPDLAPVIEAGKAQMRRHFKDRSEQLQAEILKEWKRDKVYPYQGEVKSSVERVERELFDVVAVTAAGAVNESNLQGRRLSLQLLRQAIEQGPSALRRVLNEVLELPQDKLDDLNDLLNRTSLTSIIELSRIVTDRVDALTGLQRMIFDPDVNKLVLERSQLHKVLEGEAWVFGDEYAISVSDQGLSRALEQHISILGREKTAEDMDPARLVDGSKGIVDLMLSRSLRLPIQKHQHLVVELKRPARTLNHEDLTQITRYATAVAADPRFNNVDVQWDFWLLGTDMDDFVLGQARQSNRPPGMTSETGGVTVWAKTWAEVLDDCQQRLKYVQDRLDVQSTIDDSVDYLSRKHAERLPAAVLRLEASPVGGS